MCFNIFTYTYKKRQSLYLFSVNFFKVFFRKADFTRNTGKSASEFLQSMNFLDSSKKITERGRLALEAGVSPRLANLILFAAENRNLQKEWEQKKDALYDVLKRVKPSSGILNNIWEEDGDITEYTELPLSVSYISAVNPNTLSLYLPSISCFVSLPLFVKIS